MALVKPTHGAHNRMMTGQGCRVLHNPYMYDENLENNLPHAYNGGWGHTAKKPKQKTETEEHAVLSAFNFSLF